MRSQIERWFLFTGNRYVVAGEILVLMTGVLLALGVTRFAVRNIDPLFYVGSGLVTGNITLITVVVAINQVVLSEELESPGQLRDEIERTAEYRQAALDGPAPSPEPAQFLRQLLQQTREYARSREDVIPEASDGMSDEEGDIMSDEEGEGTNDEEEKWARDDTDDEASGEATEHLLVDLPGLCDEMTGRLDQTDGLTNVVVPVLGVDYADYINDCFLLRSKYGEDSHTQLHSSLDDLASDLKNAAVARQTSRPRS